MFDITCFTGVNQWHVLRTLGQCDASSLSSSHIRSTDFELACSPDSDVIPGLRKEAFEKNTRDMATEALTYMASIHLAYEPSPNHKRITPSSSACLQATRENLTSLESVTLDPSADIVTVILDTVTDQRNIHLVKNGSTTSDAMFEKVLLAHLAQLP